MLNFNDIFEDSILKNLDNPKDDELLTIISQEILVQNKEFNLKNFIIELKKLNYSALKHFSTASKYLNKIHKKHRSNNPTNKILELTCRLEIAEMLMNQGATIEEIKRQSGLSDELMTLLFKQYYAKIDINLLRHRLIMYYINKIIKLQSIFFKEAALPLLEDKNKLYAETLLSSFTDMMNLNRNELAALEIKADNDE